MRLQGHSIGKSPIREVKGGCPKDVITELDLRGDGGYENVNWRKSLDRREQYGQWPRGPSVMEQWSH